MQTPPLHKRIATWFIALALIVGAFGAVGTHSVRAESGSSNISSANEEVVIRLLQDLIKLLTERLEALLDERGDTELDNREDDDTCEDSSSDDELEIEADIFTNETVVKVKIDGDEEVFVTDADTRAEIIDAVRDEYSSLSEDAIDDALEVEEEDRASRASDKTVDDSDDSFSCDDDDDEDDDEDDSDDDDQDDDEDDDDEDDDSDDDEDDD